MTRKNKPFTQEQIRNFVRVWRTWDGTAASCARHLGVSEYGLTKHLVIQGSYTRDHNRYRPVRWTPAFIEKVRNWCLGREYVTSAMVASEFGLTVYAVMRAHELHDLGLMERGKHNQWLFQNGYLKARDMFKKRNPIDFSNSL